MKSIGRTFIKLKLEGKRADVAKMACARSTLGAIGMTTKGTFLIIP